MHVVEDLGIGGLERVVVTLCQSLDPERYERSVLCLRGTGPLAAELREGGVRVIDVGGVAGTPDYLAFRKVARALREHRVDVLHTHNTLPLFDGFAASRLVGVRTLVHTDHARDFPDKRRYMVAERVISHFLYRIAAVSEHTRDNLMRYEGISPRKIVTIPNGILESRYTAPVDVARKRRELDLPADAPVIGLGARLTPQKGVEYLLHAMVRLRERIPRAMLLVAGTGEQEPQLRDMAAELGLGDAVRFLGARLDIPELLQVFDVYAMPSVWEGLPMALLEAMAAGCPIVATEVGGIPTALTDDVSGALVPPRDPEALAERLARLLLSPETRARYADEARRVFRERYSAEAMTRRYEEMYLRQMN